MAILIVDDDPDAVYDLTRALESAGDGWTARSAGTGMEGLALAVAPDVECVLLDYHLPDLNGVEVLRELRRQRPDVPVIMVTGSGSEAVAVEVMKLGAADYVVKEGSYAQAVPGVLREVLGKHALERLDATGDGAAVSPPLPRLDEATLARFAAEGLIARSRAMLRVLGLIERAAQSRANVLIEGESGTGKEVCARAIHAHGPRAAGPFVAQNVAAIPETLLESELFGHAKGAFTGADRARPGLFDQADGGPLFLDEIGEADPAVQAKLLRVLPEREFRPVGATAAHRVDVRVVAATNRDLRHDIAAGQFRRDLYHRLRVFPITLPPLRQRRDDIAPLAQHFLERFTREEDVSLAGFHPETIAILERYAWPGNVRDLENEVHRLVLAATPGDEIVPDAVAPWITSELDDSPATMGLLKDILRQVEAAVLKSRLRENGYNRTETAATLGITRAGLFKKMRALGIATPKKPDEP